MTQATEATIDVDSDDSPAEEDNSLFSKIEAGCHDGLVIHELGMAIYSIREELGIEYFVGLATHGTQEQFFEWMIKATGSGLEDWEPVTVPLFECWESATDFHNDPDFQPYDYRVWSSRPSSTAVTYHKVDVFALRHRSWRWLKKRQERKFFCAWSLSLAKAEWYRDNPGIRPKPTIMEMRSERGFCIAGKPPRAAERTILCWPSADLKATLKKAKNLFNKGVQDLVIYESGVGFSFNEQTESTWKMLLQIDLHYGQNFRLMTLCDKLQDIHAVKPIST